MDIQAYNCLHSCVRVHKKKRTHARTRTRTDSDRHAHLCSAYLELWEEAEEVLEDLLDGEVAARVGNPERDGTMEALQGEQGMGCGGLQRLGLLRSDLERGRRRS